MGSFFLLYRSGLCEFQVSLLSYGTFFPLFLGLNLLNIYICIFYLLLDYFLPLVFGFARRLTLYNPIARYVH